jgi:hypothetical protein
MNKNYVLDRHSNATSSKELITTIANINSGNLFIIPSPSVYYLNTPDSITIKERQTIRTSPKIIGCIFIYNLYNLKKYVTKAAAVIHHQKT